MNKERKKQDFKLINKQKKIFASRKNIKIYKQY